ncbi:MAG: hypothetical protein L6R41_003812 [Letrouitia leprolyta]|nr:MAG: hypothetical protein L6R41_003812 [Letrouitia leprolyta]
MVHLGWTRQSQWSEYSLEGIKIEVKTPKKDAFPGNPAEHPSYLSSKSLQNHFGKLIGCKPSQRPRSIQAGHLEARSLIGNGTVADLATLATQAREYVAAVFRDFERMSDTSSLVEVKPMSSPGPRPTLVQIRLSSELERWKEAQHTIGNILPPKGPGLAQASDQVLNIFGAASWPKALKTNNALFGCGIASLLMGIGVADAPTVFSNYLTDMVFYFEHGYNHVFPTLESLLQKALTDTQALRTLGGRERRDAVRIGKQYIQDKIALEEQHRTRLMNRSARLNRRTAQIVALSESSLLGMAAEALAGSCDPATVLSDLVFSSPGTDVIDVGSDIVNSEVMNSFLNVADITDTGIVSEDTLRRVYDAYAATGAKMLTQRWQEPLARMAGLLYTWHIQNDRHFFLRRAILGWPKARKTPAHPQYEAYFDEVFDEQYRTTGFFRPLDSEYACNGEDTCDQVHRFLNHYQEEPLLRELWRILVVDPLEYVRGGQVDEKFENDLVEGSRLQMAEIYSRGLVLEMVWLISHANFHAWQVNYLFEAAMFGSILDGGMLSGKLDRQEEN